MSTKLYVGLSREWQYKLFFSTLKVAWMVLHCNSDETLLKNVKEIGTRLCNLSSILHIAISPSPDLVRAEVAKRPFEPFGVPDVKNSFDLGKTNKANKANFSVEADLDLTRGNNILDSVSQAQLDWEDEHYSCVSFKNAKDKV